ncbi:MULTISPECIES: hypothetical protein [unclassified Roseovarius]|uniref:hypothetical protein n=1 Tax=unclassified Roseovarius TaxID=2614913 RepID=UPI00273EC451|nr:MULTISPECIES: hypothetical protein [unclassified Roseovarius]
MTDNSANPLALGSLILLTMAAFGAAVLAQDSGWLSYVPPATAAVPEPAPDVDDRNALALYQSAFTAWAALVLLIPAYWFYLTKGAGRQWFAFWLVSFIAYLIHLYVSAFLFFGGDFTWMTTSSRVSAFWPGMALIIWWAVDLVIAWRGMALRWFGIQRGVLHIATFVLFFGGSAIKGEMIAIKLLGAVFAIAVVLALFSKRRGAA